MKFAIVPRIFAVMLAATLALALTGCGFFGNSDNKNSALTKGNWSIAATSTNSANSFLIGGNLTQSGTSVSGKMYITGADPGCNIDPAQAVNMTGTTNGSNIALTSGSIGGQVITIAASGSGSAFSGTYVIAGGNCDGDQGSVAGNAVPSISGTWSGPIVGGGGSNVTLSLTLTQATTVSADGTFALTGNVTFTNSSCSTVGTVTTANIAGSSLLINGSTTETDGSKGGFSYTNVLLNSGAAPTKMQGTYDVVDGLCLGDQPDTPTLSKQ